MNVLTLTPFLATCSGILVLFAITTHMQKIRVYCIGASTLVAAIVMALEAKAAGSGTSAYLFAALVFAVFGVSAPVMVSRFFSATASNEKSRTRILILSMFFACVAGLASYAVFHNNVVVTRTLFALGSVLIALSLSFLVVSNDAHGNVLGFLLLLTGIAVTLSSVWGSPGFFAAIVVIATLKISGAVFLFLSVPERPTPLLIL